jgi:hypothetical protein
MTGSANWISSINRATAKGRVIAGIHTYRHLLWRELLWLLAGGISAAVVLVCNDESWSVRRGLVQRQQTMSLRAEVATTGLLYSGIWVARAAIWALRR